MLRSRLVTTIGTLTVVLGAISGWGESEPPLFPLRGKVVFQNKPIPKAEMVFHPLFEGPGWRPVAIVGEDGSFEASTKLPGDGALEGRYKVTIVWRPTADENGEGPNFLPPRYEQVATSDLEVEAGPEIQELSTLMLKN
jgi:hypothetical protein